MKRILLSTSALAILTGAVFAENLIANKPLDSAMLADSVPADFYWSLDTYAMWRSSTDTELYELNSGSGDYFSTRDLAGVGMGFGVRGAIGGRLTDGFGWEVGGFWSGSFASSGSAISVGEDIYAVYDDSVFGSLPYEASDIAYGMRFTESSSVGSAEVLGTYEVSNGVKLLAGPRIISYQSKLGTIFYEEQDDYEGTTLSPETDTINITSTNTLVGLQAGVDAMFPVNETVSIGGRATAGVYINNASLERSYAAGSGTTSPFSTASLSETTSAAGLAISAELTPKVTVALTESVDLTVGGTFLWLNGVDEPGQHLRGMGTDDGSGTLAPENPGFGNGVNFGGVSVGLKGRF